MTNVIILAAGSGSRLKPLTNTKPKCLVKFLDKPLISYQIDNFKKSKIKNVHVILGYKAKTVKIKNITISVNKNYKTTNMTHTLYMAKKYIDFKKDLLISYGDIIYSNEVLKKILKSKSNISVVVDKNFLEYWKVRMSNPLNDLESLIIDKKGFIKEIGNKTKDYNKINGQYIGLIKIKKHILRKFFNYYHSLYTKKKKKISNIHMTTFLNLMIQDNWKIKSVPIKNGWLEFDTLEDFNAYNKLHRDKLLSKFIKNID